jgi:hypothetical protein
VSYLHQSGLLFIIYCYLIKVGLGLVEDARVVLALLIYVSWVAKVLGETLLQNFI